MTYRKEPHSADYPDSRSRLAELLPFLYSQGISKNNIRLLGYMNFLERFDRKQTNDGTEVARYWREINEVIFVIRKLRLNPKGFPNALIVKCFEGQELVNGTPENDRGRNYMLEARAAIYFLNRGYDISLETECDVVARSKETTYYIECKRLYSESKVRLRRAEAYDQIIKRFSDEDDQKNKRGIIWIDPSAIILKSCLMYVTGSEVAAIAAARADLIYFAEKHLGDIPGQDDTRMLGMVTQMVFPAHIGEKEGVLTGFTNIFSPINRRSLSEERHQEMRKLFENLIPSSVDD